MAALWRSGYRPLDACARDPELREVLDLIRSGFFSRGDTELFRPLLDNLLVPRPLPGAGRLRRLSRMPAAGVGAPTPTATRGRACRSSTARAPGSSRPTAPSANTARDIWHAKPVPVRLLSQEEVKVGFLQ